MKKHEMITLFRDRCMAQLSEEEAVDAYETCISLLRESIVNDGKLSINHFGSFIVKKKGPRKARDPRTGNSLWVPSRNAVRFRPSKALKDDLNPDLEPTTVLRSDDDE